jgi:methylmalonyl-CoA/ethylmalonyl-CoA epimerase
MPDKKLELKSVDHIGIVVRDCDKVIESWSALFGMGPWTFREMGGGSVKLRVAAGYLGSIRIDLIQPVAGKVLHSEYLEEHGEGLHHLGFYVDDVDAAAASLVKMGSKILINNPGNYVYLDTGGPGGVIFELMSERLRGL